MGYPTIELTDWNVGWGIYLYLIGMVRYPCGDGP